MMATDTAGLLSIAVRAALDRKAFQERVKKPSLGGVAGASCPPASVAVLSAAQFGAAWLKQFPMPSHLNTPPDAILALKPTAQIRGIIG